MKLIIHVCPCKTGISTDDGSMGCGIGFERGCALGFGCAGGGGSRFVWALRSQH